MAVIIDNELCNGCGRCVKACPMEAISLDESLRKAVVDPALCTECLACIDSCKKGAIKAEKESLKAGTADRSRSTGFFSRNASASTDYTPDGKPGRNERGRTGAGQGTGGRQGRQGGGRGRGSSGFGSGRNNQGDCYCPVCCISIPHRHGIPCTEMKCPGCGGPLIRR